MRKKRWPKRRGADFWLVGGEGFKREFKIVEKTPRDAVSKFLKYMRDVYQEDIKELKKEIREDFYVKKYQELKRRKKARNWV